jgi:hypothetical protein
VGMLSIFVFLAPPSWPSPVEGGRLKQNGMHRRVS